MLEGKILFSVPFVNVFALVKVEGWEVTKNKKFPHMLLVAADNNKRSKEYSTMLLVGLVLRKLVQHPRSYYLRELFFIC